MSNVLNRQVCELIVGAAVSGTAVSSKNLTRRCVFTALCLIVAMAMLSTRASADSVTSAQAQRIVAQYSPSFTSPGSCCTNEIANGPLMGNGNLGVVVVNPINTMTFLLGKNDFWSLAGGQVEPMASMALSIPTMAGASFAMQQNIYTGTVTGQFTLSGNQIQTNSWVSFNDTTNNYLFTQFTYSGSGTQAVTVSLAAGNGNNYPTSSGSSGNVLYYNVAADSTSTVGGYNTRQVRIAVGVVGATGSISGGALHFTLSPGTTVTLVSSIMSNYDSSSYATQSVSNVSNSTAASISSQLSAHEASWVSFWDASYVEFANNPVVQEEYYGSLYLLGSSSEPNTAAPGLWGPWVETNPAWAGDYTTDYNFETPPLAYFPTNHVALANSYDTAVETWLPNAQSFATSNGYTGAYWPAHIGPLPNGSYQTPSGDENMRSDGGFLATVMLEHYYVTQDANYASSIWPTISAIATFYQNYLTFNGTTYDDLNDAPNEFGSLPQTNCSKTLGFIRDLLQGAIDLSVVLNQSSTQRAAWQNILNNLTTFNGLTSTTGGLPFPTFAQDGVLVFDTTQIGDQGADAQAFYPSNQIGLGSSPTLLAIAQNTLSVEGSGALPVLEYPAAAKVGWNPAALMSNLNSWINGHAQPSLYLNVNGGGIENLELVPATISEMMMQSSQGNIILFADWPSNTNAHFGDNLAYGNFLVSSAIYNNQVLYARIISQAGKTVSITNPWPGQSAQFYRNGANQGTLSGAVFSIPTSTNDVLLLAPSGTSVATINTEMGDSLSGFSGLGGNDGPGKVLPYNVNAIYTNGTTFFPTGGADNHGNALSATLLGATQVFNGTTFTYGPSNAADAFNDQTVTLTPGSFSSLNVLAFAWGGAQSSQTFQVNYTNGTFSTATQNISDWCSPQNFSGETRVVTMSYLNMANGTQTSGYGTCYIYGYTIPVTNTLTVESITLPASGNVIVLGIQDEATSAGEGPYGGTPAPIPGTVMAENYDTGGAGVGYHVNSVNGTNNGYRSDGVDLETASAPATGNDIGWTGTGQWFRYTVNVATAGTYNVTFQVASPGGVTDGFHIANSAGTNLSGSVNVPNTGGWQTWTTVTASVTLPAGQQVLTIYQDNGGWNIDSAVFASGYNVYAIYTNGTSFSTGGADGNGYALSATLLGSTQAFNGTTFTYGPSNAVDAYKNVTIPVTAGAYSGLNVLGFAVNGNQASQTFTIHYTNGTTSNVTQSVSDWCSPQSYSGETAVKAMAYRNTSSGGQNSLTCNVYGYTLAANSSLTVSSVTLPANNNVIVLGVQPLGRPYNVNAIYTNGSTFSSSGGADSHGNALSATLLGATQAFNGTTFTYGPSNAPDAFTNVTVPLTPGSFSSLNILAFAWGGAQTSQTFQVNYTNGTHSTATQSISDWCTSSNYTGETKVVTLSYLNTASGGQTTAYGTCYVYGYTIPVTSSLTVQSITLPANGQVNVLGVQDQQ